MNNSQKKSKLNRIKNILSQMPAGILKKAMLYGLPILASILVVAVVATSILTNPSQATAELKKVESNVKIASPVETKALANLDISKIEQKDLAQISRDSNALALQSIVEDGTGVELKKPDTISVAEIDAKAKTETTVSEVETSTEATPDTTQPTETPAEPAPEEQPAEQELDPVEWVNKYVNTFELNIRDAASFGANIVGTLTQGDIVTEMKKNHEWSEVLLDGGKVGYVYNAFLVADFVAKAEEVKPEPVVEESAFNQVSGTKYIAVGAANVRENASADSKLLETLYLGAPVTLNSAASGWYNVTTASGITGFIREDLLRDQGLTEEEKATFSAVTVDPEPAPTETPTAEPAPTPEPTPAPAPVAPVAPGNSGGVAAARIAASKVGGSYSWGATGPYAFDCSGLVQFSIMQAGGYISRTAASQAGDGIAVPFSSGDYSNLAPGDVLCFSFGGGISHSGLYIGGGEFVHAVNQSEGIRINSLNGYWGSSLAYARRVFY